MKNTHSEHKQLQFLEGEEVLPRRVSTEFHGFISSLALP